MSSLPIGGPCRVTDRSRLVTGGDGLIQIRHPANPLVLSQFQRRVTGVTGFPLFLRTRAMRAHTRMYEKCKNPSPSVTHHQSVTRRGHGH
jgi:hypothetical protein